MTTTTHSKLPVAPLAPKPGATFAVACTVPGQTQPFVVSCLRDLDVTACEFFSGPRVRHIQQTPALK